MLNGADDHGLPTFFIKLFRTKIIITTVEEDDHETK